MKLTMKLTMSKSTTNTVQPPMRDNIEVELLKIHNIKPTVNSISISFFIIYRNRGRRSTTTAATTQRGYMADPYGTYQVSIVYRKKSQGLYFMMFAILQFLPLFNNSYEPCCPNGSNKQQLKRTDV
mmetsp:Transcript_9224/g.10512  ORF Transcript_9224/g.10512 Transcript_9224/m.10512 type:complete len:126 (+) Transcript_9224:33-410(+)